MAKARERGRLRRRLREIDDQREEMIRDLGGLALEMHKRDRVEMRLLNEKASEIAALDEEAKLLRRALDEGLSSTSSIRAPAESQPQ